MRLLDARLKADSTRRLHRSAGEGSQVWGRGRVDDNVSQRVVYFAGSGVFHKLRRSKEASMADAYDSDIFSFPVFIQEAFNPVAIGQPLGEHARHLLHHLPFHVPHAVRP